MSRGRTRLLMLGVAGAALLAPAMARADFSFAAGTKWTVFRYVPPFTDLSSHGESAAGNAAAEGLGANGGYSLDGWNRTNLDMYLGFGLSDNVFLSLLLDVATFSRAHEDTGTGVGPTHSHSWKQFGVGLAFKYYFEAPKKGRISPYIHFDFFKMFASADDPDRKKQSVDLVTQLASPLGFSLALGIEYFFSRNFGLGAEILGMRFTYSNGEVVDATNSNITHKQSYSIFSFYTALTLNFRFYGTARLYTDQEQPK